jgi:hypothetical protein
MEMSSREKLYCEREINITAFLFTDMMDELQRYQLKLKENNE